MKLKTLFCAALILALSLAGCSAPAGDNTPPAGWTAIDLSAGRDAAAFAGMAPESIPVSVIRQGETMDFLFEGVSLDALLTALNLTVFSKIELSVSDREEPMDITDWAKAAAGVFLAWNESGNPESPIRVFPKDAATGNLLIRNVTALLVTP